MINTPYYTEIRDSIEDSKELLLHQIKKKALSKKDVSFESQKSAITECVNATFFIEDGKYLYACGTQEVIEKIEKINSYRYRYTYSSNFLVFGKNFNATLLKEISIGSYWVRNNEEYSDPILWYRGRKDNCWKKIIFGSIINVDEICDLIILYMKSKKINDFKRDTEITVLLNGELCYQKKHVDDFSTIDYRFLMFKPKTADYHILYDVLADKCVKLAYISNIYQIKDMSELEVLKYEKHSSKELNGDIPIWFSMSDCVGANILRKFGIDNNCIKLIPNLIPYDSTVCYEITLRKTEPEKISFVFNLIGKCPEVQYKVFGVRLEYILNYVCQKEFKGDLESTKRAYKELTVFLKIKTECPQNIIKKMLNIYGNFQLLTHFEKWIVLREIGVVNDTYINKIGKKYFPLKKINESTINMLGNSVMEYKWKNEFRLYLITHSYYPDTIFHYNSKWLENQHLDIFIPCIYVGIEYQGLQHYEEVEFFNESLQERQYLDEIKRNKCKDNGVLLIEWSHNTTVNEINFIYKLREIGILDIPVPDTKERWNFAIPSYENEAIRHMPQKVIRQYNLEGIFLHEYNSTAEASQNTGISMKSIRRAIRKINKTAGGYIWNETIKDSEIDIVNPVDKTVYSNDAIEIVQVDCETGEILNTYNSINAAVKATGINRKSISDVMNGKQKRAGGYYWIKNRENS